LFPLLNAEPNRDEELSQDVLDKLAQDHEERRDAEDDSPENNSTVSPIEKRREDFLPNPMTWVKNKVKNKLATITLKKVAKSLGKKFSHLWRLVFSADGRR